MARNYIDNLSEKTLKGMIEKAKKGIWPSFAPPGYRNVVGSDGKRTFEPDPVDGEIITGLFDRFSGGDVLIAMMLTVVMLEATRLPRVLPRTSRTAAQGNHLLEIDRTQSLSE